MRRLFLMAILILAVSGASLKTRAQETSDMNDRVASLDEVLMDYDEHRSMLSRIIADRGLQDAVAGKAYIGYMTWDKWIVITQQELSEEDKLVVYRARKIQKFLLNSAFFRSHFPLVKAPFLV